MISPISPASHCVKNSRPSDIGVMQRAPLAGVGMSYSPSMAPDGTVLGEYDIPTPGSGARCIAPMSDGRLFFTQWDAGLIGEIIVK